MKIRLIVFWALIIFVCPGCLQNNTEESLKALRSSNITKRYEALSNIVKAGEKADRAFVPALVKLVEDKSQKIRLKSIRALGAIAEKTTVPLLIEILNDSDAVIQEEAVVALGKIKDFRAVPPLIDLLNKTSVANLKLAVIWSLGNIGDEKAVSTMMALLDSQDKYVRYNANRSLKKID